MRVLYFGTYSTGEGYPRNRVLIGGLRRCGVEVVEVHEEFWESTEAKIAGATGGLRAIRTALKYAGTCLRLSRGYLRAGRHDLIVVGYAGQIDVFLARLLSLLSGKPVVLDAFLSLYDTIVLDRELVRPGGPAARGLAWIDRTSCRLADLVLLDTAAHARYFARLTGLPAARFARLFVGEDDRIFPRAAPRGRTPGEPLRVLWFGTYVPLQGVETVLDAAARLAGENVRFRLVGCGQQLETLRARALSLDNVDLVPRWASHEELREEIVASHVCLGIFGDSEKAGRVIPCKVYDALAAGRPVVTRDSPAVRELLEPDRSALLVAPADGEALAAAIRRLAGNDPLRRRIARAGAARFDAVATPTALGGEFRGLLARRFRRLGTWGARGS